MNQEIEQYLGIVEMKLYNLIQDVKNIRNQLAQSKQNGTSRPTFFDALKSEDIAPGANPGAAL